jgi:hypothetical protein
MAEHPSRGVSYSKEEMMEGIGWTPMGLRKVRYFLFYFPHNISDLFSFCYFISCHFIFILFSF